MIVTPFLPWEAIGHALSSSSSAFLAGRQFNRHEGAIIAIYVAYLAGALGVTYSGTYCRSRGCRVIGTL